VLASMLPGLEHIPGWVWLAGGGALLFMLLVRRD